MTSSSLQTQTWVTLDWSQLAAVWSYRGGPAISTLMCDFSKRHDTNDEEKSPVPVKLYSVQTSLCPSKLSNSSLDWQDTKPAYQTMRTRIRVEMGVMCRESYTVSSESLSCKVRVWWLQWVKSVYGASFQHCRNKSFGVTFRQFPPKVNKNIPVEIHNSTYFYCTFICLLKWQYVSVSLKQEICAEE